MSNYAETIADLATSATAARTVESAGRVWLVTPEGCSAVEVTDQHGLKSHAPAYISQCVTLQTVESLVDYTMRFKTPQTMLFADVGHSIIAAMIDYHPAAVDGQAGSGGHVAHRASMGLQFSEEWKTWTAVHGRLMSQLDFARFIEENGADIVAPKGGELLDAVRDLQARRKVNFIKAVRTASDNENFEYQDETEMRSKGGIEVPTKFRLGIPVYFGEPTTELYAFLRWKLDDGQLTLGVALHRAEHVRQAVFKNIVMSVAEDTGCPVVFGKL